MSNSRDKILGNIPNLRISQTVGETVTPVITWDDRLAKFIEVLRSIGGAVIETQSYSGVREYITQHFDEKQRVVSMIPLDQRSVSQTPTLHPFDNVDLCVIRGHFGISENGAIWVTEDCIPDRVLPFICQHLIIVLSRYELVNTLHEAYDRIGALEYDFGTFIAGPSKTADIEQSLVLGAHGPRTMTVALVEGEAP